MREGRSQNIEHSRVLKLGLRRSLVMAILVVGFLSMGVLTAQQPDTAVPVAAPISRIWISPSGDPLPFTTNTELEEFLRTAEVVKMEEIPIGVTDPRMVWLKKDGIEAKACFRDVDISQRKAVLPNKGIRKNWRDCCLFECAAYQLAKLLGLNNIPPVVMRNIKGEDGTLQIWVENATMETDRVKQSVYPPNLWRYQMQWQVMRVFDALIYNDDRNAGNILYDSDWNLWMIDHTRSFSRISDLPEPSQIKHCERNLWERLCHLNEEEVEKTIGEYIQSVELKALFKRREKLIAYIEDQIEERGEKQVLFSFY